MRIHLLYFGIVRERLGRAAEDFELDDGTTVAGLLVGLEAKHEIFAIGASSLRVAINQEYADSQAVLADGDEVAIIPPVSGGAGSVPTICGRF